MNGDTMQKGITPIIAIVLLLMMTVAAAGGAYVWFTDLQDDLEEQAEEDAARSISINDLRCLNEGGNGVIEVYLKNGGSTEIDADPVDMNVRYPANGSVVFDATRSGLSLMEDDLSSGVGNLTGQFITEAGNAAAYSITTEQFSVGTDYEIEFVFTDEEGTSVSQTCQARE